MPICEMDLRVGGRFRWGWRFEEHDGATTVRILIEYPSQEALDAALATGMTDGMEMSYEKLDGRLTEGAGVR